MANFWQTFGKLLAENGKLFGVFGAIFPYFPVKIASHIGFAREEQKGGGWVAKWQTFEKWAVKWAVNLPAEGVD